MYGTQPISCLDTIKNKGWNVTVAGRNGESEAQMGRVRLREESKLSNVTGQQR